MKTLYLDCFSGISGDMMLGALLDLGIEDEQFIREVAKIKLFGFDIEIEKVKKYMISGTDVHIIVHDQDKPAGAGYGDITAAGRGDMTEATGQGTQDGVRRVEHIHGHELHIHDNMSGHMHDQHIDYVNGHIGKHHSHSVDRSLDDILELIEHSELDERVKEMSARVFNEIAAAEGKVHGVSPKDVHFHEIGAVDSIIDIVGVCICLRLLDIGAVYSSELHEGRGFVDTKHGRLPVPVPAVAAMLEGSGIPVVTEDIASELVTPTGIGLAKTLSASFGPMPAMKIDRVGYGFGKRDTGRLNALRVIMGEPANEIGGKNANDEKINDADIIKPAGITTGGGHGGAGTDSVIMMEANIDDMTAEALGYAMERLFDGGALDVYFTPVYMKKNRPATMLTVLGRTEDALSLADLIFSETTTLGIRESIITRTVMERRIETVALDPEGEIRVKLTERRGVIRAAPEYEDCKAYAARTGLPLADVYEMARNKYSASTRKNKKT